MFPVAPLTNMTHDFEDTNGDTRQVLTIAESPKLNTACGFLDYIPYRLDDLLLILYMDNISTRFTAWGKRASCLPVTVCSWSAPAMSSSHLTRNIDSLTAQRSP